MLLYFRERCLGHIEEPAPVTQKPARSERSGPACCVLYVATQNEILPPSCQNLGSCDEVA